MITQHAIDLTQKQGLEKYLDLFIYNTHPKEGQTFRDQLESLTDSVHKFSVQDNGIEWGSGGNTNYGYINDKVIEAFQLDNALEELRGHLTKMIMHVNLSSMEKIEFKLPVIKDGNVSDFNGNKNYQNFIKHSLSFTGTWRDMGAALTLSPRTRRSRGSSGNLVGRVLPLGLSAIDANSASRCSAFVLVTPVSFGKAPWYQ